MRTLAAALVAIDRPLRAAIKIVSIAGVGVLLTAQTVFVPRSSLPDLPAPARSNHTYSWLPALKSHIRKCWSPARGAPPAPFRIHFELRRNGTLAGRPRHFRLTSDEAPPPPPQLQRAIQAIEKCQPYSFLPQSEYAEGWDKILITFEFDKPDDKAGSK
jgi:hypothetical protein